jgi:hypothetical protein
LLSEESKRGIAWEKGGKEVDGDLLFPQVKDGLQLRNFVWCNLSRVELNLSITCEFLPELKLEDRSDFQGSGEGMRKDLAHDLRTVT